MALSTIARPYVSLNPVFNPMKYIVDSTNKNEEGFRYVFDLYYTGTSTKILETRVAPKFGNGYGEFNPARVLQSLVSATFDHTNLESISATDSFIKFDLKAGEEYVVPIDYTASLTQTGDYVTITVTHTFVVGDQVVITQADGGLANPNLEGLFTVVSVTGTTTFTVNSQWNDLTDATINGSVVYADNRKTITRDLLTYTAVTAFNGVFSFKDFIAYNETDFILSGVTKKLLTSCPTTGMRITPTQSFWMNAWSNTDNTLDMIFTNSNGDVFRLDVTTTDNITQWCVASPDIDTTLSVVSGTAGLIKDDTTFYEFYISDGGVAKSQTYRFDIDRRCKIEEYEVYFLDRLGSIGSFAFQLRDKLTGTVTKQKYNQYLSGRVASSRWIYDMDERGMTSVNHSVEEVLELNTNYLNQTEIDYFTELATSPYTWVKIDDVFFACVIEDSSYEVQRVKTKRLVRKTLKIKLSNQNMING